MNKLFKHAFDPFQGKYFAVFLPVKRYSYPQEILLYAKFPPSFSHRATIEFLRARITSTLITSKNNPFGTGFRKFCRANTKKKNPTMFSATRPSSPRILPCLRGGGFSSGQDRRPYTTASQTSAIKRERRGVKLYCGRGGGSLLRAPLEKGCYNFIVTRCDRILSRGQLFRAARRDLFVRRAQKEKLSSR